MRRARSEALKPPPKLSLSEWANRYAVIPKGASADAGKFRSFGYQDGLMDAVTDPTVERITFMKGARVGYALAIDTPLPTPSGWTTMGDVAIGDDLFDENGNPCRVLFKSEVFTDHDCYRITFCDGNQVVADGGHRWLVDSDVSFEHLLSENNGRITGRPGPGAVATKSGVIDTQSMAKMVTTSRGRRSLSVRVCSPLALRPVDLPIPPYTFGLWLGDGHTKAPLILQHRSDVETADYVAAEGVHASIEYLDKRYPNNATIRLGFDGGGKRSSFSLALRKLGLTNGKYVPECYLRASVQQRLDLLRGLMDSDGTIGKNGRAEFTNTNRLLSEAVYELAISLGMKVQFAERPPQREGCLPQYRVGFRPFPAMNPFRLKRKANRVIEYAKPTINNRRRIVSIERCEAVPVQCIQVSSPSSLFLCGKGMVPTHNTRILDHVVGYFIHQDPSPVLIVQPTEDDARDYSASEIEPILRETPVLKAIAGDLGRRAAKQKIDKREFRNGASVQFIGAESPSGFRRITVRVVAFDEVDGYSASGAGDEGDQIALGIKRTETYWNRKIILGSTPKLQGTSRIEKSWNESDQRHYHVKCPHCGTAQTLKWENLKWDKAEDGEHLPETAYFRCESKGCRIEEHHKPDMIAGGEWKASKPFKGHAGFHIWSAYSLFPNATWASIAAEWLEVYKDPLRRQPFVNLVLGLPYKQAIDIADPEVLKQRVEQYNWETLPSDVKFVTAGVDTHPGRLEVTLVGWGENEEAWVARHEVLHGDASHLEVWGELDKLLATPCETDDGRKLLVQATCIDSAGHNSEMVYKYARERRRRRIYACIGRGNPNPASPRMIWPKTASRTKNSGDKPYIIGVDTAKDDISSRLAIVPDAEGPTPRAIRFPAVGLSGDYFEQLTSEHAVTRRVGSVVTRKWEKKVVGGRNETWDCLVYALAARMSLPVKLSKTPTKSPRPQAAEPVADNDNTAPEPETQEKDRPKRRERQRWGAYK